jgi:hypothetical protein
LQYVLYLIIFVLYSKLFHVCNVCAKIVASGQQQTHHNKHNNFNMLASVVAEIVPSSWSDRRRVLLLAVALQALLAIGLVVSALVVAGTANA